MLQINNVVLRAKTYLYIALVAVPVFFALKFWQGSLEDTPYQGFMGTAISAVLRRLPNISFWFVIFGFCTIFMMARAAASYMRTFGVSEIKLSGRWIAATIALVAIEWFFYIQAVYRDGGTFFYAIGSDYKGVPFVCVIQTIEGLLNLVGLAMLSLWCVIGHCIASELPELEPKERKTQASESACRIARACLLPVVLLLGLSAVGTGFSFRTIDWRTGIKNAAYAQVTAVFMWLAFILLFFRVWGKCHEVLKFDWKPPFIDQE